MTITTTTRPETRQAGKQPVTRRGQTIQYPDNKATVAEVRKFDQDGRLPKRLRSF